MKKHFVITFLLMIFILIVHCTKEKKTNLKNNIYTYIHIYMYTHTHTHTYITKEKYDFWVYLAKNDGNGDIAIKERKPFQRNANVKLWRKRQSEGGFLIGKSVI